MARGNMDEARTVPGKVNREMRDTAGTSTAKSTQEGTLRRRSMPSQPACHGTPSQPACRSTPFQPARTDHGEDVPPRNDDDANKRTATRQGGSGGAWSAVFFQACRYVYWLLGRIAMLIVGCLSVLSKLVPLAASAWHASRAYAGDCGRSGWELAVQGINGLIQYRLTGSVPLLALAGIGFRLLGFPSTDRLALSLPAVLWNGLVLGWSSGNDPLHDHPPVWGLPDDAINKLSGHVVIAPTLPTLGPRFSHLVDGLGMGDAATYTLADIDKLARQLRLQMADTEADRRGPVANVAKFPSQPLSLVQTPTDWAWSWLAGRNPVSTRAAAVRATASSAAANRQSTTSQLEQLSNSRFAAAVDRCSLSVSHGQPAQKGTAQQLRNHDDRVKKEAKAGIVWQSHRVLTGVSPLGREVQAVLEQERVAIRDAGRQGRVTHSGNTVACKALASVERAVGLAVAGTLMDHE